MNPSDRWPIAPFRPRDLTLEAYVDLDALGEHPPELCRLNIGSNLPPVYGKNFITIDCHYSPADGITDVWTVLYTNDRGSPGHWNVSGEVAAKLAALFRSRADEHHRFKTSNTRPLTHEEERAMESRTP